MAARSGSSADKTTFESSFLPTIRESERENSLLLTSLFGRTVYSILKQSTLFFHGRL